VVDDVGDAGVVVGDGDGLPGEVDDCDGDDDGEEYLDVGTEDGDAL
jgi:hypothetical protein